MTFATAQIRNPLIVAAAKASWATPEVAEARSKRYAATLQIGDKLEMFPSAPMALESIGVFVNMQSIRVAARDCEYIELMLDDGAVAILAMLEI